MALTPQVYSLPLNNGVDTKTDPKLVDANHSLVASNVLFQQQGAASVRGGTQTLNNLDQSGNAIPGGINISSTNNDLTLQDGKSFFTFNTNREVWDNRGSSLTLNLTAQKFLAGGTQMSSPASAIANGLLFVAWLDSRGGVYYSVRDASDQNLFYQTDIAWQPNAINVQLVTDGVNVYIFVTVLIGGSYALQYYSFLPTSPYNRPILHSTPVGSMSGSLGAVQVQLDPNTYMASYYQGPQQRFNIVFSSPGNTALSIVQISVVTGNTTGFANQVAGSNGGANVFPLGITTVPTGTPYTAETATMGILFTSGNAPGTILTSGSTANVTAGAGTIITLTQNDSTTGALAAIPGASPTYGSGAQFMVWYSNASATSGATTTSQISWPTTYVAKFNTATNTSTAVAKFIGLELVTNLVNFEGQNWAVLGYPAVLTQLLYNTTTLIPTTPSYQTSYVLVSENGVIHTRFADNVGTAPIASLSNLQLVNNKLVTVLSYQVQLATVNGVITPSTGLQVYMFDASDTTPASVVPFDNLEGVNDSQLQIFDGGTLVEQGFYEYPELSPASFAQYTTGGALGLAGFAATYTWYAIYSWTDYKGRVHYSDPSFAVTLTLPAGTTNSVSMFIPYLPFSKRFNRSMPVQVKLYRTRANDPGPSLTAYRVASFTCPNTTQAGFFYLDTASDASIEANEYLPFAANGEIEPDQAPAFYAIAEGQRRWVGIPQEQRLSYWYSKQRVDGRAPEFSAAFTGEVEAEGGPLTAIGVMDDAIILFKANRIYKVLGSGPNALGSPSDGYSFPQLVSSTDGCTAPKSVLKTDYGLFFQGQRGILLLDRSLQLQYIGDPVYAYRSDPVTASFAVPFQDQVRFVQATRTLVYDYKQAKWSTYDYGGVSGTLWDTGSNSPGARTPVVLSEVGKVRQEAPGLTTDDMQPINLMYQTPWMKVANMAQGWGKLWEWSLLGTYLGPHQLYVDIFYDYQTEPSQTVQWSPGTVLNSDVYGSASPYGSDSPYGGIGSSVYQVRSRPAQAQCQAFSLRFRVVLANGASCQFNDLAVTLGVANYTARLPANKTV